MQNFTLSRSIQNILGLVVGMRHFCAWLVVRLHESPVHFLLTSSALLYLGSLHPVSPSVSTPVSSSWVNCQLYFILLIVTYLLVLIISALEFANAKSRRYAATLPYYFFLVGNGALSFYGYFIRSWRLLVWVGTALVFPYVLLYWFVKWENTATVVHT